MLTDNVRSKLSALSRRLEEIDRMLAAPETAAVRPAASGNRRKWKTACARKAPTAAAEFDGRNL